MNIVFLLPPVAFLLMLGFVIFQFFGLKIFSSGVKPQTPSGGFKSYACGEDFKEHHVQPDYSQFFPFAFFFTIIHVVAMVVATVPKSNWAAITIAVMYLVSMAVGLLILFRRGDQ
jgi:NADH-quinone oxidoreductase subunit A